MYLDRCVLCCESDWDDYFELHEITTKDTYILKVSFRQFIARHNIRPVPKSRVSYMYDKFGTFPELYNNIIYYSFRYPVTLLDELLIYFIFNEFIIIFRINRQ